MPRNVLKKSAESRFAFPESVASGDVLAIFPIEINGVRWRGLAGSGFIACAWGKWVFLWRTLRQRLYADDGFGAPAQPARRCMLELVFCLGPACAGPDASEKKKPGVRPGFLLFH